ncbi:uncharacterized protein M6B38_311120 [Iris pallida]|uniref:Uncharacterized protein n=1 Tax=Iris pallida TaxID=29817 RepID=A0AAX6HFV4_IRIPA|nr:uncharacterized protein M6B38_311120 [Iris pallida]
MPRPLQPVVNPCASSSLAPLAPVSVSHGRRDSTTSTARASALPRAKPGNFRPVTAATSPRSPPSDTTRGGLLPATPWTPMCRAPSPRRTPSESSRSPGRAESGAHRSELPPPSAARLPAAEHSHPRDRGPAFSGESPPLEKSPPSAVCGPRASLRR